MSQICSKCGAVNGELANFCGECGVELNPEQPALISRRDIFFIVVGVLLIALFLFPTTTRTYTVDVPYEVVETYTVREPYLENVTVIDRVPYLDEECTIEGCHNTVRLREVARTRTVTRFRDVARRHTVVKLKKETRYEQVNWLFGVRLPWHRTWKKSEWERTE
ncbi:zinc ribbon domain-containing protein [Candidatus Woesearchaeota archaeon]|nr:MAG: zinc ribbon domain-containing protein [Candidatus Woesearchaeota archaeon]